MTELSPALQRMLAISGMTVEALRQAGDAQPIATHSRDTVEDTPELRRILDLPRRPVTSGEDLIPLFDPLRKGSMQLRPIQALALHDIYYYGGLLAPMRVGAGKTLTTYLAPIVAQSVRPLLIVPAKLREKTRRDFAALSLHWRGPSFYRIESYERLGRVGAATLLDDYAPDLIVADEAHKLKNRSAAVTRRVRRYMGKHPNTRFVALSGTMTKRSLRDYAHLAEWALPKTCPLPTKYQDLEAWSEALDERKGVAQRDPGALVLLCNDEERNDGLRGVRRAFQRRVVETPGVVATSDKPDGMSLVITGREAPRCAEVNAALWTLRNAWELPDGQPFADALTKWRHAREIGLGFYYRWDPPAPDDWLLVRKLWCQFCRNVLQHNRRGLDSELMVANAVDAGEIDDGGLLQAWREVRPSFEPNPVPEWLSDVAVNYGAAWLKHHNGIAWTEHSAFGRRLAEIAGVDYYGRGGRTDDGRFIDDARGPIVASIGSNAEGRNLQQWHRNLVMCPPSSGLTWEQLLGRTHRDGQTADEVAVEIYFGCSEHLDGFAQARADAEYRSDTSGQPDKLTYATIDVPDSVGG